MNDRSSADPVPALPPLALPHGPMALGVDVTELDRIERVVKQYGQRFLDRIYTPGEQAYCRGRIPQLAARFAAKEAVMKALGTGRWGVGWREVEVVRGRGAPSVTLHGRARKRAEALGITAMAISITHGRDVAIVFVAATKVKP